MTAEKKITGIKIHLGVDTLGLPHGIHVTTADVTDRTGARFAGAVMALLNAEVEVAKRNALHTFEVIPKRWIVERSLGWLDHFRRLWKNCELKLHTVHQMVSLAFITILLRRY
jgi:transposase